MSPSAPSTRLVNFSGNGGDEAAALCSVFDNPVDDDIFPHIQPKPPLKQPEFPLLLAPVALEKGSIPSCPQPPFQWL